MLTGSLEEPEPGDPKSVASSPYAVAKWAATGYARFFHRLYQLPVVIMRVFMVYGPAQRDESKLVPYVIRCLLGEKAPKLTSGQRQVDWIYVEDVVDGFLAAVEATGVEGTVIDVGSGKLVQIKTVVEYLVQVINPRITPLFGALADRPFEQERVADITQSYEVTGWKPVTPLEEGLRTTVEWYRARTAGSLKVAG
jgi:nucleoside-diphosphate-sugar epimerase